MSNSQPPGSQSSRNVRLRSGVLLTFAVPTLLVGAAAIAIWLECRQANQDRALIDAVKMHRSASAISLLKAGASANSTDAAVPKSTLQWLLMMLMYRVTGVPAPKSPRGRTALQMTVEANDTPVATALLARGANDFHVEGDENDSLVRMAIYHENTPLAWLLWEKGAAGKEDLARLAVSAVELDNPAAIARLAVQGAPMTGPSPYGKSPFFLAAERQDWRMMRLVLSYGATVDDRGDDIHYGSDISALCLAARRDDFRMATFLLAHGADVNAWGKYGGALFKAVEQNDVRMLRLLLAHRADPNLGDYCAPLPCVLLRPVVKKRLARSSRYSILMLLLEAKANPNAAGKGGPTLLGGLASDGDLEMLKAVLHAGADVNYRSYYDGSTALMCAAEHGRCIIARLLLCQGARVNLRAKLQPWPDEYRGDTALDYAIKNRHWKAASLLRQWGGRRSMELPAPIQRIRKGYAQ